MPSLLSRTGAVVAACALTLGLGLAASAPAVAANVSAPIVDAAPDAKLQLSPLGSFETGVFEKSAAEIVQAYKNRLFVVNAQAGKVDVLDYANPKSITKLFDLSSEGVANSVAIRADGLGVVAFEAKPKTDAGHVLFFDANASDASKAVLGTVTVGALPDMVTFSKDGTRVIVANEGEPADDFSIDPEGSVSVIAAPAGLAAPAQSAVRTATFNAFEAGGTKTLPAGVRVFGPRPHGDDKPVSRNLEPEYITVDGDTAYVTLQEANAIATVDLASASVTQILPLGYKDHGVAGAGLDTSDKDGKANIRTVAGLYGVYMPDGISSYQAGGSTYLVTANEGDSRAWGSYTEDVRVKSLAKDGYGPVCASSPLAKLTGDNDLGRLKVTRELGYDATAKCYDKLYAFGGRSFSIWKTDGTQVFDSGDAFEQLTAKVPGLLFNSDHAATLLDDRSDDKGPEPESVAIGTLSGRTYAFVGFERVGGIAVYDITDPTKANYVTYVNNRDFAVKDASTSAERLSAAGDLGPEGVAFIPASASATGQPLLAVGNEVSGTTTLFQITDLLAPKTVQVLTINDFHGRLAADPSRNTAAGAAAVAGAVKQLRAGNPNTLFVSAGDNIGASTFDSFIAQDTPTIDALKSATLDVSAVGNHEFDRGFADLTDRVIPRYDAGNTTGKSDFALGANVYDKTSGKPALKEYTVKTVDGVRIAFIGTVTETTPEKVTPTGVANLTFGSQLEAANRVAKKIADEKLADVTILLAHEGLDAPGACSQLDGNSTFAVLAREASPEIDAIVSGDSHQKYSCEVTLAGGQKRPVIQAHQYSTTLGRLTLQIDRGTGTLTSIKGSTLPLVDNNTVQFPADPATAKIVSDAVAQANVEGAKVVGSITADITRAKTAGGTEDRASESSLSNLLADMYTWTTNRPSFGGTPAQIGVMNPGGVRADLIKTGDGSVTYRQVATVQPFANTLVTVALTGAQLKSVLEEQWRGETKLHLGISNELSYTFDVSKPIGSRIVEMKYRGKVITPSDSFTIVTNSFLAAGGDGFNTFAAGVNRADTGQVDLQASIEYFTEKKIVSPASVGRAIAYVAPTPEPTPEPSVTPTPTPTPTATPTPSASSTAGAGPSGEPGAIPAAPPASVFENSALRGGISLQTSTPTAGDELRIYVGTERAGQFVHVFVYSTPTSLGWHKVGTDGYVTVTVPKSLAGAHHVLVQDANGAVIGWRPLTVRELERSGSDNLLPALPFIGFALLAGAGLVAVGARRRAAAARTE